MLISDLLTRTTIRRISLLAVKISSLPGAGSLKDNATAVTAGQFVPVADITGGKLVFTPAAFGNGTPYTTFTFQVQDNGGTANGGVNLDTTARTFEFDVTPVKLTGTTLTVNGTTGNDTISISEQSTLVVTVDGVNYSFNPSQVTAINVTASPGDDATTVNSLKTGTAFTSTSGSGADTVTVNAAVTTPVTLVGGSGNDTLTGGSGNDTLVSGIGTNTLNGGTGNDTYNLARRTVAGSDVDTVIDSSGTDSLSFSSFTDALTVNLQTSGNQTVDAAMGYKVNLQGTFETVTGGSGNDVITGNATVGTTINGGAGNDILVGGSASDTLTGGDGNDILIGGLGTDTLSGNNGNDILIGGTLSFSSNILGLQAILAEWNNADTYASIVNHLRGTVGGGLNTIAGGASGDFFLSSSTVTLGTTNETLLGGAGADYFWKNGIDTNDLSATDVAGGEQFN